MPLKKIASFLDKELKRQNISTIELSRLTGVSNATLETISHGYCNFNTENIIMIANAINCYISAMVDLKYLPHTTPPLKIAPALAMSNLRENLKGLLETHNISINELAIKYNLDINLLFYFYNGAYTTLPINIIYHLALSQGSSIDQLLGRELSTCKDNH